MPMTPDELSELKTLIAAARKKPINFGLCIGKKPDSMILYLHRKKTPEILARLAKKTGDTAKVAMGTVSISGKKMALSLIGDPPSGLAKRTKLFLTSIKMPFQVQLLDASGAAIGEDETEDSAGASGAAAPEPTPPTEEEISTFKEAYAAAQQRVKQLAKLKVDLSAIKTDLAAADKLAKEEKISDAMLLLAGLAPKFMVAEQAYCLRKKTEAREAIDLASTYLGAALEIPKLELEFKALEVECAKSPINAKEIATIVKGIIRKRRQLRKAGKAFKREYNKVRAYIKDYCEDYLVEKGTDFEASVIKGFEQDIEDVLLKLDEHSAKLAKKMAYAVFARIYDEAKLVEDDQAYQDLKTRVAVKLATLYADRANGIEQDCVRLETKEKEAAVFETNRAYSDASVLMHQIDAEIASLQVVVLNSKLFQTALRALKAQMQIINKSPQYEFVVPEFKALLVALKAVILQADQQDFEKATNKAIDLLATAKALEIKASKAAPLTDFENGIESGDIDDLRQQANDILADLKAHPRAKLAPVLIADVQEHVEALDSTWNQWIESSARSEMVVISDLANEARKKLDAVDVFYSRAVTLGANTAQFGKTHAQAVYIRPFLVKISLIVTLAKASALDSASGIAKDLTEGERLLALAKTTADAEVAYRIHLAKTEASITAISAPEIDFDGKAKILADITTQLEAAAAFSTTFKHEDAEKALGKADTLVMTANISSSAKKGTPPDEAEIKALLAQLDGEKALDELVASLPDSTQQDVMKRVLEVRFGMEVNIYANVSKMKKGKEKKGGSLDIPAPKLLDYYEALKSVPASHTSLNPSLLQFDSVEEDKGGFYSPSDKRVVIELDDLADKPMGKRIGNPKELDDIDPDCVSPAITEEPTMASWVTYHEIGHAVDDRESFMDGKANNPDFGGWVEYGGNIAPVAAAAAAHFKYDPSFVERTLAGGKPKTPKIPPELSEKEGDKASEIWLKRKTNFQEWRKAVSVGGKPWKSASAVNTHKINGRMYQEAYSNNWVSYLADARKKGVTGYQFRAPGEWYAELYAAYHSKKLNASHPANSWLATP